MNYEKGFTLIELLVVIAIIALLSSMTLASVTSTREKARLASAKEFASMLDRTLGSDVVGGWQLDEGAGTTVVDSMGDSYTGTLYNAETFSTDTPSLDGRSLSLNGLNQYAHVPEKSDGALKYLGSNFTLSVWIKPDNSEVTAGKLMSKPWNGSGQYNYTLERTSSGIITLNLSGATGYSLSSTVTVPQGKWSHIAATVNNTKDVAIYIDGKRVAFGTHAISSWTPPLGDFNYALAIGTLYPYTTWAGNTSFSFGGLIDNPRVFAASILK